MSSIDEYIELASREDDESHSKITPFRAQEEEEDDEPLLEEEQEDEEEEEQEEEEQEDDEDEEEEGVEHREEGGGGRGHITYYARKLRNKVADEEVGKSGMNLRSKDRRVDYQLPSFNQYDSEDSEDCLGKRQPPHIRSQESMIKRQYFFGTGICHFCNRKDFTYGCYCNYIPQSCSKVFCADCLNKVFNEDILEVTKTNPSWICPFKRKACHCIYCIAGDNEIPEFSSEKERNLWMVNEKIKSTIKSLIQLNEKLFAHLNENSEDISEEEVDLVMAIIHKNLQKIADINKVHEALTSAEYNYTETSIPYSERFSDIFEQIRKQVIDKEKNLVDSDNKEIESEIKALIGDDPSQFEGH